MITHDILTDIIVATSSDQADSNCAKKRGLSETDFSVCLKCRMGGGMLVKEPQPDSYERFLKCVRERAQYGDREYVSISRELANVSGRDLVCNQASCHLEC